MPSEKPQASLEPSSSSSTGPPSQALARLTQGDDASAAAIAALAPGQMESEETAMPSEKPQASLEPSSSSSAAPPSQALARLTQGDDASAVAIAALAPGQM